jgi:thiol-disulfide isomerase/thioredoxin
MSEPTTTTSEPGPPVPPAGRRGALDRISRPVRWALVGVIVVVALAFAVWPRGGGADSTGAAPAPTPAAAPDLRPDRARAALPACTSTKASVTGSALAGVRVSCLADGATVDLGSLIAGAPALVDVWASWCQPCQQELPALDAYAHQPGAIRVVGVQVQSPQKDGLDLLASLGVHLPTVYDPDGATTRALKARPLLPASYVVRADGTATLVTEPAPVLDSAADVRQAVTHYLGAGGGGAR